MLTSPVVSTMSGIWQIIKRSLRKEQKKVTQTGEVYIFQLSHAHEPHPYRDEQPLLRVGLNSWNSRKSGNDIIICRCSLTDSYLCA